MKSTASTAAGRPRKSPLRADTMPRLARRYRLAGGRGRNAMPPPSASVAWIALSGLGGEGDADRAGCPLAMRQQAGVQPVVDGARLDAEPGGDRRRCARQLRDCRPHRRRAGRGLLPDGQGQHPQPRTASPQPRAEASCRGGRSAFGWSSSGEWGGVLLADGSRRGEGAGQQVADLVVRGAGARVAEPRCARTRRRSAAGRGPGPGTSRPSPGRAVTGSPVLPRTRMVVAVGRFHGPE